MKIAVCTIAKGEKKYIRDWVEYYKNLGFCNVIFNDNSENNDNSQKEKIQDYIETGFVIYQDYKGMLACQNKSYEETYFKFRKIFDWIGFFDIDEFICLEKNKNINELFGSDLYKNANLIYVNWKCYGDSGKIKYEPIPVWERFKESLPKNTQDGNYTERLPINVHIKSFVKCIQNALISFPFPHNAKFINIANKAINPAGNQLNVNSPWQKICWENMWLNHYHTLTIEEYLERRVGRLRATTNKTRSYKELYNYFLSPMKKLMKK